MLVFWKSGVIRAILYMLGKLSTWKDDSVKLAITIERCSMQLMKTL